MTSVDEATLAIPGFTRDPKDTLAVKHDMSHAAANAFSGEQIDEEDISNFIEYVAVTAQQALYHEEYLFLTNPGDEDTIRRRVMNGVRRDIANYERDYGLKDGLLFQPFLNLDNMPFYEDACDRGLKARKFFLAAAGRVPHWVSPRRTAKLPIGRFGARMIRRPDGLAESFELYPDEVREEVVADIKERLAKKGEEPMPLAA